MLAANNCGPEIDNPYFFLPNPNPNSTAINGNVYHRLTMRIRYAGVFGLTGGPTGGAVARLIWWVASDKAASDQNVHDIVVYPGWQTITSLRLDPNEDLSARNWYVDFVRLTKDVEGRGAFDWPSARRPACQARPRRSTWTAIAPAATACWPRPRPWGPDATPSARSCRRAWPTAPTGRTSWWADRTAPSPATPPRRSSWCGSRRRA